MVPTRGGASPARRSVGALGAEIEQVEHRLLGARVGEDGEALARRAARRPRPGPRWPRSRRGGRSAPAHARGRPSCCSRSSSARRQKARSVSLPRAKASSTGRVILPSRKSSPTLLPSSAWRGAVVERVVDQLEGDAQIVAVGGQRRLLGRRAVGDHGADLAGGAEQGRRSWPRSPRDRPASVVAVSLAVISCCTSPSAITAEAVERIVEHAQAAVGDHELEGAAEQEVADQHRRLVAPDRVGGGRAAAQVAVVDHVVVQQRGGVDELDAGGEAELARAAIAAQPRRRAGSGSAAPACRRRR